MSVKFGVGVCLIPHVCSSFFLDSQDEFLYGFSLEKASSTTNLLKLEVLGSYRRLTITVSVGLLFTSGINQDSSRLSDSQSAFFLISKSSYCFIN
jgi:hypothetical protein